MEKPGERYPRGYACVSLTSSSTISPPKRKKGITINNFTPESLRKVLDLIYVDPLHVILFYLYYVLELDHNKIHELTGISSVYSRMSTFIKKYNLKYRKRPHNINII